MSWKKPLTFGILKVGRALKGAFGENERRTMALVALNTPQIHLSLHKHKTVKQNRPFLMYALLMVGLLLWAVLAQLPRPYRCQRCDSLMTKEREALGHEREGSLQNAKG